jgi:membrane-associated phospholipid phosphatase
MRLIASYIAGRLAWIRENRAILFLGVLALGFLALSLVVHLPAMLKVDQPITRALQTARSPVVDLAARSLSFLGNTLTLVAIGAAAAVALLLARRPWAAALTAFGVLGVGLNHGVKGMIGRPRPTETMVDVILPAIGLSFPSGHAMASVMVYGFLAFLAWVHVPHRRARVTVTMILAVLPLAIGISRIYLGAHWFSDVIGGWTAGLFLLFLMAETYKWLTRARGGATAPTVTEAASEPRPVAGRQQVAG